MSRLRLATRGSPLALWQARLAAGLLRGATPGLEVEIVVIRTTGDRSAAPLAALGGVGVFVKELEEALGDGRADLAVHSLKDLPVVGPEGFEVVAVLEREDPRDALVSRDRLGLAALPPGARVATASPRRRALLRHARPDLAFVETRGNVDTRLAKLARGEFDAIVLALAGLKRLGRDAEVSEILPASVVLPAPGQGAIALEARSGSAAAAVAARLDHPATRRAVEAERSFLFALGGGCSIPVGALATLAGEEIVLDGLIADPDDGRVVRDRLVAPASDPRAAGLALAARVRASGGAALVGRAREGLALAGRRIVVTRASGPADELSALLAGYGAEVVACPAIAIVPPADSRPLAAAAARLDAFDCVAVTSANAVAALGRELEAGGLTVPAGLRFAAVGAATAAALGRLGIEPWLIATEASGDGLARAVLAELEPGAQVLFPRAREAAPAFPDLLQEKGVAVTAVEAYRTVSPPGLAGALASAFATPPDAVVFASPSAVRHVVAAAGSPGGPGRKVLEGPVIACIGKTTAAAAAEAGLEVGLVPERSSAAELAAALAAHLGPPAR